MSHYYTKSSSGGGGGGTPGGGTGDVQYNSFGTFAGASNFTYTAGQVQIIASASSNTAQIVKGAVGQTADLQQWQDSAGTAYARVTSDGAFSNPTAHLQSEVYGDNVVTAGRNTVALGSTIDVSGTYQTAVGSDINLEYVNGSGTPLTTTKSVVVGNNIDVNGSQHTAVGTNLVCGQSVLVGWGSTNAVTMGYNLQNYGISCTAIGSNSNILNRFYFYGTSVGTNNTIAGTYATVIGANSTGGLTLGNANTATGGGLIMGVRSTAQNNSVAIGADIFAKSKAICIGDKSYANDPNNGPSICIGERANVGVYNSTHIGSSYDTGNSNSAATADYQIIFGGDYNPGSFREGKRTAVYFGKGVYSASPEKYTFYGTTATTGSGANGGDIAMEAGAGDGAGVAGNIILNNLPTSNPGVTGALWNDGGTVKIS